MNSGDDVWRAVDVGDGRARCVEFRMREARVEMGTGEGGGGAGVGGTRLMGPYTGGVESDGM